MSGTRRYFDNFAVIDSFLPEEAFRSVSGFVAAAAYRQTPSGRSIWHSADQENPSQSLDTFVWPCATIAPMLSGPVRTALRDSANIIVHPSGTPVDALLEAIGNESGQAMPLLGREGSDWVGILASAFVYNPGARAAWHRDDNEYRGAFIYYVHEKWEPSWGGELLISHDRPGTGDGVFVAPLPNRLVILQGGALHSVASVSARTGGLARTSVAGFFATQQFANKLMSGLPATAIENGQTITENAPRGSSASGSSCSNSASGSTAAGNEAVNNKPRGITA